VIRRPSALKVALVAFTPLVWRPALVTSIRVVVPFSRSRTKRSEAALVSPGTRFVAYEE